MEHLASRRKVWYTISLIAIVPGVISLILFGLKLGIDFTGGTLWELEFNRTVTTEEVRDVLARGGYEDPVIQLSDEHGLNNNVAIIRIKELPESSPQKAQIEDDFRASVGDFTELQISTVGSSVGNEIRNRAILAVAIASVGILLYIAYAFGTRKIRLSTDSPRLSRCCTTCCSCSESSRFWARWPTSRSTPCS